MTGLSLTKKDCTLRVVHASWQGRPFFGTIIDVPNRWHARLQGTVDGQTRTITAAQDSLVWAQDFEKARR